MKRFIKIAVLFLAFLALVFVSALVTMKAATWGRTVVVPDVSGRELVGAINTLKQAGLEIKVSREEYSSCVPSGSVIAQMPLPGTTVKKGRNVSVVVCLGSQEVTVPDFHGQTFRMVLIMLKQVGLTLGDVARAASSDPRDSVVAQEPLAQTVIQKGGKVNVLLSDGGQGGVFITPDLTGKNPKEAEDIMKSMSVSVTSSGKGDAVVSQEPRPGYPINAGGVLKVVLGAKPSVATPGPATPKPPAKPPVQPGGPPYIRPPGSPADKTPGQKTGETPGKAIARPAFKMSGHN
jgi:beta-lactam-binding protein with PASTA domain